MQRLGSQCGILPCRQLWNCVIWSMKRYGRLGRVCWSCHVAQIASATCCISWRGCSLINAKYATVPDRQEHSRTWRFLLLHWKVLWFADQERFPLKLGVHAKHGKDSVHVQYTEEETRQKQRLRSSCSLHLHTHVQAAWLYIYKFLKRPFSLVFFSGKTHVHSHVQQRTVHKTTDERCVLPVSAVIHHPQGFPL